MECSVKNSTENRLWQLDKVSMAGPQGDRLKNVSLCISSGITAVIGPSGAGKSSLLNLLVKFEQPDSGEIYQSEDAVPFFWVPQNHGLWQNLTVREHLLAMMETPQNSRIDKILEQFDIAHKDSAYPSHLSKGEQSRLAMARALVVPPRVLVMDEPLINLPPSRQMEYWNKVINIALENAVSLVYATHSPKYVIGSADCVVCVKDSEIFYSGSVEALYHSPESFELAEYLGDINWFTDENKIFIKALGDIQLPLGIRPEQVRLEQSSNGSFKVINSIFRGEMTETTLASVFSKKDIILLHRSAGVPENGELCEIVFEKM